MNTLDQLSNKGIQIISVEDWGNDLYLILVPDTEENLETISSLHPHVVIGNTRTRLIGDCYLQYGDFAIDFLISSKPIALDLE